jgi:hypothetical protein
VIGRTSIRLLRMQRTPCLRRRLGARQARCNGVVRALCVPV